jgi:HD-like signal output (HDOD) protein
MFSKPKKVEPQDLKELVPLRNLPNRIIRYVAELATLEHCAKGQELFRVGDRGQDVYYVLKGEVRLDRPEKGPRLITAGTTEARFPIGREAPAVQSATTTSRTTLIKLSRELLQNIERIKPGKQSSFDKSVEVVEDELDDKLYVDFYTKLQDGKFELPSMPDVAVRISKVVNNPNTNSADIAKVIQMDPALTGRLISVVNSPLYAGSRRIDSCPDAVTRLGRQVTRNLVLSFVLKSLFRTRNESLRRRMSDLWAHSRQVAAICHVLARKTKGLDPDRAMLAGLIHDIGAVPIISAAREYPELADNPEMLEKTINRLRGEVGTLVLKRWDFMDEFSDVAAHAEDWTRDTSNTTDYTDLVIVSQLHAYIGTPRMQKLPRLDLVPAFHKLAMGKLTPRHSLKYLDEAKNDVQAVETLLDSG